MDNSKVEEAPPYCANAQKVALNCSVCDHQKASPEAANASSWDSQNTIHRGGPLNGVTGVGCVESGQSREGVRTFGAFGFGAVCSGSMRVVVSFMSFNQGQERNFKTFNRGFKDAPMRDTLLGAEARLSK